ncbi:MAG: hypothetical protein GY761_19485 [Hyphomicrobiales bacterium]|nr:hypothetical protein [Hyphomicrobiales bacterium]
MKRMLFRLIAYLVAGALFGAAGWLLLLMYSIPVAFSVKIIAILAASGLISAVLLLMPANLAFSQGIRINSPFAVALMDSVCIIAATIVSLFIIDGYSRWFTGTVPLLMNDPFVLDVVAFMYLPSALVLAWFVTSSGSQIIVIDEAGLVVAGAFGLEKAKWSEVEKLSPNEQYVIVSRLGFPMPRHLRTNLVIATNNGEFLTVYQPAFKSTMKNILEQMKVCAPFRLQSDLDEMEVAWL